MNTEDANFSGLPLMSHGSISTYQFDLEFLHFVFTFVLFLTFEYFYILCEPGYLLSLITYE
jgi:hypothetical protein